MGFVKTPAEIVQIQAELSSPRFVSVGKLSVQFRTDPDVVRALLPPPLEPTDEAVATATVGRWHSNCLGEMAGGNIYLSARHDGVEGAYVLAMFHDTEQPIQFGRDLFGEPKKLARIEILRDGMQVHGWVERNGVRIIEITGDLVEDMGPTVTDRSTFNVKSRSASGGIGLEEDAILTRTQFHTDIHNRLAGPGTVTLTSTLHDPVGEVPVLEVLGAIFTVEDSRGASAAVARIPAGVFLPYHLGRMDDFLSLNTIPG